MRELFVKDFVRVYMSEGILRFDWKDINLSEKDWESFREEYFSLEIFHLPGTVYVLNNCEKQDVMTMGLIDSLVVRAEDLVNKESNLKMFLCFVSGDNYSKQEEFDSLNKLLKHNSISAEVFRTVEEGLNWLNKNKG